MRQAETTSPQPSFPPFQVTSPVPIVPTDQIALACRCKPSSRSLVGRKTGRDPPSRQVALTRPTSPTPRPPWPRRRSRTASSGGSSAGTTPSSPAPRRRARHTPPRSDPSSPPLQLASSVSGSLEDPEESHPREEHLLQKLVVGDTVDEGVIHEVMPDDATRARRCRHALSSSRRRRLAPLRRRRSARA